MQQEEEDSFHQQVGFQFKEHKSKVMQLWHIFVRR
jgi:hypothetical protein